MLILDFFEGFEQFSNKFEEILRILEYLLKGNFEASETEIPVLLVLDEDKLSVQHIVQSSVPAANTFAGTVENHRFHSGETVLTLRIEETLITHKFKSHSRLHNFETGEKISVTIPAEAVRIIN